LRRALSDRTARFLLGSSAAYVVLRVLAFERGPQLLGDTQTYRDAAALPVLSLDFLAGNRAFVVPLVWKLLGGDGSIVVGQLVVSIAAWLVLALAVAAVVRHPAAKALGLWLVFVLSLSSPVTQWDHALMSESISFSTLALLVGTSLLALNRPSWARLAVALLAGLAWVMVRDTHAYAALVVAPALAVAYAVRRRTLLLAALAGTLAILGTSLLAASHGGRGDTPIRDAIWIRLQHEDPGAMAWLQAHGYSGLYDANTPRVYRSFLLHHPLWVARQPLEDRATVATFSSTDRLTALYTPHVDGYDSESVRTTGSPAYVWRIPGWLEEPFWPHHPGRLGIELLVVLGLTAAALALGGRPDRRFAAALVILLAVYPQLVVVWHVSGQEVDRHALGAAAQVRIAALLFLVVSVDVLGQAVRSRTTIARPATGMRSPA
jgi:hypothetical protein